MKLKPFPILACASILFILISFSCTKDKSKPSCDPCTTVITDTPIATIEINLIDSQWIQKSNSIYVSNLDNLIGNSGTDVKEIVSVYILSNEGWVNIGMNGEAKIYKGSMRLSTENKQNELIFSAALQSYYGETTYTVLPFRSLNIQVSMKK